jgi:hypothetical protein
LTCSAAQTWYSADLGVVGYLNAAVLKTGGANLLPGLHVAGTYSNDGGPWPARTPGDHAFIAEFDGTLGVVGVSAYPDVSDLRALSRSDKAVAGAGRLPSGSSAKAWMGVAQPNTDLRATTIAPNDLLASTSSGEGIVVVDDHAYVAGSLGPETSGKPTVACDGTASTLTWPDTSALAVISLPVVAPVTTCPDPFLLEMSAGTAGATTLAGPVAGKLVLTGWFNGGTLGGVGTSASGVSTGFVGLYSPTAQTMASASVFAVTTPSNAAGSVPTAVTIVDDTAYIVGELYGGSATFDGTSLPADTGGMDVFIAQYGPLSGSPTVQKAWALHGRGHQVHVQAAVATSAGGGHELILAGTTDQGLNTLLDNTTATGTPLCGDSGQGGIFLLALTVTGSTAQTAWFHCLGPGYDAADTVRLAADANHLFVAGSRGPNRALALGTQAAAYAVRTMFVARFDRTP